MQEGGGKGETFLWQLEGSVEISCGRGTGTLNGHCCTLIQAGERSVDRNIYFNVTVVICNRFKVQRKSGSLGITITTDPLANK